MITMKNQRKDNTVGVVEKLEMPLTIKNLHEDEEGNFFRFTGFGSTFNNEDLVGDVMLQGCFKKSLKEITPTILWQHDSRQPIGVPEFIAETKEGLELKVIMPIEDEFVSRRVMPQLKIGSIKAMSIGFRVIDFFIKDGIRFIKECKLLEVSLVTFPANPEAVITSVKSLGSFQGDLPFAPRSQPWCEKEAIERIKVATGSMATPSNSYKDNFLWLDDNANSSEKLSLAFVDLIEGVRTIVPRALFSARASLRTPNSGVTIEKSQKLELTALIDRYIAKLDEVEPVKMLEPCDLKDMSKRELETALRESGTFSKNASVMIASNFLESGEPPKVNDEAIIKTAESILQKEESAVIVNLLEDILGDPECPRKTRLSIY